MTTSNTILPCTQPRVEETTGSWRKNARVSPTRSRSVVGAYIWRQEVNVAMDAIARIHQEMQCLARNDLPRQVSERLLRISLHIGNVQTAIGKLAEIRRL